MNAKALEEKCLSALKKFPDAARRAFEVKSYSLSHYKRLFSEAVDSLKRKDCKVFQATDASQAVEYIAKVIGEGKVVRAAMTIAAEVELDSELQKRGIALTSAVSKNLKQIVEKADVGITGADAVVAETGSVVFQENKGDMRLVSNLPPIHIVLVGRDKIVPTLEDAMAVLRAGAICGKGEISGNYVSVISGPSRTGDIEFTLVNGIHGPKEVHVVLLDNGRTEITEKGFSEVMQCIECWRCLRSCPGYHEMGEEFGGAYPGGRGLLFDVLRDRLPNYDLLQRCIDCGRCAHICPVNIDVESIARTILGY